MRRRDELEEAGGPFSGGMAEFPGIMISWNRFQNSGIKTGYGGRLACGRSRQLRRNGKPDEDKA